MRIIRWLAIPAMVAVGAGAVWVTTTDPTGAAAGATTMLTATATVSTVAEDVAATGAIRPAVQYGLSFGNAAAIVGEDGGAAGGDRTWTVTDVTVALGDSVTAGQVLATADTTDVEADLAALGVQLAGARQTLAEATETRSSVRADTRAQLATAEDDLTVAQLNLKSAQESYEDASGTSARRGARVSLIGARAQREAARETVAELRKQLNGDFEAEAQAEADAQATVDDLTRQVADLEQQRERATLRAPVDGVISALDIVAGFPAPSTSAIVVDSATLEVVADVVESDLSELAVGQSASVSVAALDLDAAGSVTAIAPSTTSTSSSVVTYPVTVTLTDPDPRIRPGMSTDVTITTAVAEDVVAVPLAALQGRGGQYTVQVMASDGTVEARPVSVGLVTETMAEVASGVAAGERVVVGTNAARTGTGAQSEAAAGGGFPGGGFPGGGFPAGGGRGFQGGGG